MSRIEKRFVNDIGHSRRVAEEAVRRLRHIPVQPSWSYLDVGCGNGAAALLVADTFGLHVLGVDVDPQQIAMARSAAGDRTDVLFMTADATCLPFDGGQFDIIATNKTTHHIPRWSSAIAEMGRVLKPQGYLVYADLKAPSWLGWVLKPVAGHAGVFTGADLDRCFASWHQVHRETGWLHYQAILQKP
jgi:ubiquinone/menaquinone biosynthesis C-methylase UbiE